MTYKKLISRGLIFSILLQFFIPFQIVHADNQKVNSSGSTIELSKKESEHKNFSREENYNDYVVALHKILKDIRRENHKKAKNEDFMITESQKNTLKELKEKLRDFKSKGREKLNKSEIQKPGIKRQQFEKSLDTVNTFVDKLTQEKITSDELTKILPLTDIEGASRKIQIKKQDGFHFDRKEKIKKQDIEKKNITEIKEKIEKKENFDEIGFRENLRKGILVADMGNTGLAYVHNWITERPKPEDFAEGEEIEISPEIEAKALELSYDPVEIYNFVTEEIDFEMYKGSKKGSRGCLIERRCNDVDTGSLMIALLRASHIPARYVRGDIVRKPEEIRSLFAVETNEMVAEVFNNAGRDFSVVAEDNWTWETIEYFYTPWTWVELYVHYDMSGGRSPLSRKADLIGESSQIDIDQAYEDEKVYEWVGVSPSFKIYTIDTEPNLSELENFNAVSFWGSYLSDSDFRAPYRILKEQLNITEENKEEKLQKPLRNPDPKTVLDVRMPYVLEEVTDRVSQLPDSERIKVNIRVEDNQENIYLEKEYFAQELNHRELEIKYEGATDDDTALIEEYGNIYNIPPSLLNLKATLERDGIKEAEGVSSIGLGKQLNIIIELKEGNGFISADALKFTVAGTEESILMNFGRMNYPEKSFDEILEDGKGGIAKEYLRRYQEELDDIAGVYNHHYRLGIVTVIVGENVETLVIDGEVQTYDYRGMTIDVEVYGRDYNHIGSYDKHRKDFHYLLGLQGSYLEHTVFEDVTKLEAISTVKGIKYARANPSEYTIYEIDQNNISLIDGLPFVEEVKQSMRGAVNEGKTVITPNKRILMEDWYGLVYIAIDPETGNGGYIIGEQPMNGGWTASEMEKLLNENCSWPAGMYHMGKIVSDGSTYKVYTYVARGIGEKFRRIGLVDQENWETYIDMAENNQCEKAIGLPVSNKTSKTIGDDFYSFWNFSNGAVFEGPGYNYQMTKPELFAEFREHGEYYQVKKYGIYEGKKNFMTYVWDIEIRDNQGRHREAKFIYNPEPDQKKVYIVWDVIGLVDYRNRFTHYGWPEEEPVIQNYRYIQQCTINKVNEGTELYAGFLDWIWGGEGGQDEETGVTECSEFSDVEGTEWFCEYVNHGLDDGWVQGYEDGTLKPNNLVSRAEFITFLGRAKYGGDCELPDNYEEFSDVESNHWAYNCIHLMRNEGVVEGYEDGKYFRPDQSINKAEALKMTLLSFGFKETCFPVTSGEWYDGYLVQALLLDIVTSKEINSLNRAQTIKIIDLSKQKESELASCSTEEVRRFKTSLANVNIRKEKISTSEILKTIPTIKTELYVIGNATDGEYVDAYKTDRWYKVYYDGEEGYVLATLLHVIKLGDVVLDDNFVHEGFSRGNYKITGIVLHGTLGNNSAINDRNGISSNGIGAHYYIDRDGNIAQALSDFRKIHHVGYTGLWENIRDDGSNFTIGIEIANWGPITVSTIEQNGELIDVYKNVYGNEVNTDIVNIETQYPNIWKIWSYFENQEGNVAWAGLGVNINEKNPLWQSYTESQIQVLKKMIQYLEERYAIPHNHFFEYVNPNSYEGLNESEIRINSFYYYPRNAQERVNYNNQVYENSETNFKGIFQHHNITGKFDAGPALIIDELKNN